MSRQDDKEADALALHIAAAQQQAAAAAAPFGIMQPGPHHGHGLRGVMPPMMGMIPHNAAAAANFFGMNHHQNTMSMNPSVAQAAAMMAQSQQRQRAQRQHPASAFSHAAAAFGGLPTHNNANMLGVPPAAAALAAAQNIVNSAAKPPGVQPRLVHDAASAPRPMEPSQPKRGPGRPVGSGRNRMKQHHNHGHPESMKDSLSQGGGPDGGGGGGKDPQTGYPYFSDSPTVTSQDSSDVSVPNININNSQGGGGNSSNNSNSSRAVVPPTVHAQVIFGSGRPEMPPPEWYASCMSLGLADDRFYLSELQCLLRDEFVEVFGTTEVSVYFHII